MGTSIAGVGAGMVPALQRSVSEGAGPVAGAERAERSDRAGGAAETSAAGASMAPVSATPVGDPKLDATPDDAALEQAIATRHDEAADLDAAPKEQGFLKGLMSKALSFIKNNSGYLLAGGAILGLTVLTGGAAAFVPALAGLAASAATLGACNLVERHAQNLAKEEQLGKDKPGSTTEVSPQRFEEQERMRELERKLAQKEAESVDLLGLNETESVDLLDMNEAAAAPATAKSEYAKALEGVDFSDAPPANSQSVDLLGMNEPKSNLPQEFIDMFLRDEGKKA